MLGYNITRREIVDVFDFYLKKTIGAIIVLLTVSFFINLFKEKEVSSFLYSDVSVLLAFIGFFSLFIKVKENFILFFKSWFSGFGLGVNTIIVLFSFIYEVYLNPEIDPSLTLSFLKETKYFLLLCFVALNYVSILKIRNKSGYKRKLLRCFFSKQHFLNVVFIFIFFSFLNIVQFYLNSYFKINLTFEVLFAYYLGSVVYHFLNISILHFFALTCSFLDEEDKLKIDLDKENNLNVNIKIKNKFSFKHFWSYIKTFLEGFLLIAIFVFSFFNVYVILAFNSQSYFIGNIILSAIIILALSFCFKKEHNEAYKIISILQLVNSNIKTNISSHEIYSIKAFEVTKESEFFTLNYLLNYLNKTSCMVKNKNQLILYLIAKHKIFFKNNDEIKWLQKTYNFHHVINEDEINIKKIKNEIK